MPYVSNEEVARAREMDLLTYQQNYEPENGLSPFTNRIEPRSS